MQMKNPDKSIARVYDAETIWKMKSRLFHPTICSKH